MSALSDARANLKDAESALAALSAGSVSSYSRPGLSVTKRSVSEQIQVVEYWRKQVSDLQYGFYTLGNLSEGDV